jgi:hypothetical protein
MKYDQDRIDAIRRTWLTPNWIPGKEFHAKAAEDVNYLIDVVNELTFKVAEVQNHVRFKEML